MSDKNNRPIVQVSADEIERNLLAYLRRVEDGETFVIVKAGKLVAEIKSLLLLPVSPRPYALCAGEFTVPDDFDAPLPENVLREDDFEMEVELLKNNADFMAFLRQLSEEKAPISLEALRKELAV